MRRAVFVLLVFSSFAINVQARQTLTIYRNDLAQVEQNKEFNLKKGLNRLVCDDISPEFLPQSLTFDFPGFKVLSLKYQAKRGNSLQLLNDYLDQRLTITTDDLTYSGFMQFADPKILILSEQPGGSGIKKMFYQSAIRHIEFLSGKSLFFSGNSIEILVNAAESVDQVTAQVNYLTRGLSWRANYLAVIDEKAAEMELSGWAEISNQSNIGYTDTQLRLLADSPSGDAGTEEFGGELDRRRQGAMLPGTDFAGDYTFKLDYPFSIDRNEIAKIPLFDKIKKVKFSEKYLYQPWRDPENILRRIELINDNASRLGFPLPAGNILIYRQNPDAPKLYLGRTHINNTPGGERIIAVINENLSC